MSALAWVSISGLGLAALIFFGLWRRGSQDSVNLTNFIILILLEDQERTFQAENLKHFLESSPAPTAEILAAQASAGLSAIAAKRASETTSYVLSLAEGLTAVKANFKSKS